MTGPLHGVRVIDLTSIVLGPIGTQMLGDAGADVIKIETATGDSVRHIGPQRTPGMSAYFLNLNRNKRSVVLNLKRPLALAALMRLIAGADVFVHNMRPSAAARLGLDYPALAPAHPRLIHASASGFRQHSSRADEPAYDDIIQGMSGLAQLNGAGTGGPRYVPSVMADKICGQVLAGAVAMALYHRERTGRGQALHVPMLDTMLAFLLPEHLWGATIGDTESGMGYTRLLSPHRRPYPTSDGHICLIAVTDAQWERLLHLIGRPDLIADPRFADTRARSANVDFVYGTLAAAMRTRATGEWLALLAAADLPHGPANALSDLPNDPYLRETDFFRSLPHPTDPPTVTLAPAVDYSDTPAALRRPAPRLGEHTADVLAEAGLNPAEIEALTA